jgi:hypothetical protein
MRRGSYFASQIKGPPLIEGENNEKVIYIDSINRTGGSLPDGCSTRSEKGTEPAASFDRHAKHYGEDQDSQEAHKKGAEEHRQHGCQFNCCFVQFFAKEVN